MRPGVIDVYQGDRVENRLFVSGGFAEVNERGCTVLSDEAYPVEVLMRGDVEARLDFCANLSFGKISHSSVRPSLRGQYTRNLTLERASPREMTGSDPTRRPPDQSVGICRASFLKSSHRRRTMAEKLMTIPLSSLRRSLANIRKTDTTRDLEELAASIAAHGLLQNLTVQPVGANGKKRATAFEVVAGGRRLAALKLLAMRKRIAKGYPVPCPTGCWKI